MRRYIGVLVLLAAIVGSCSSQPPTGESPSCTNSKKDGNETAVDCGGGTCPPCQPGRPCATGSDCATGVCTAGACAAPSCTDGAKNGTETGTDCGGTCPACPAGTGCMVAADCQSRVCTASTCQAPSCTDTVKNGAETDVDCGGGTCPACAQGKACAAPTDCQSPNICQAQQCVPPTCNDGVKDGNETDTDCGGACSACAVGKACGTGADCQTGVCTGASCQAATCLDGVKNGAETGTDCGGGTCPACAAGQGCAGTTDCQSGVCTGSLCIAPACNDLVKNGAETDVDCGGGTCPGCAVGKACGVGTDCNASVCAASTCAYAQSCKALYAAQPTIASGAYSIQPTGVASAFTAYCDMTDSGGGWTLVMKINGKQADQVVQNFSYDNALWTNATTLNPTSTDLTVADAKFQSFATVPFTQILGAMTTGTATATLPFAAGHLIVLSPAGNWTSLMSLMQQPVNTVTFSAQNASAAVISQWTGLSTPTATLQANCNWPGINMQAANCGGFPPAQMARVRIGLLANQENDCCSPDSYTGFGGEYTYAACYATNPWYGPTAGSAGGSTCIGGADVQNMGYLFVR